MKEEIKLYCTCMHRKKLSLLETTQKINLVYATYLITFHMFELDNLRFFKSYDYAHHLQSRSNKI